MTATVRAARPTDTTAIRAIYATAVLETVASFEEDVPSADELRARMMARPRLPWLVADDGDSVVGYAYAGLHRYRPAYRWSADVSVYIDGRHRGRGVGRLLYERLIGQVGELGYLTLFAGITLPNPASVGLHSAVGFQPVGVYTKVGYKFGAWHDVSWWRLPLSADYPEVPDEPSEWTPDSLG